MEKIDGRIISSLPFEELQKVSDLIEFDGPILSHFKDKANHHILFYWVDYDQTDNRWLIWKVEKVSLLQYLNGQINLRSLLPKENELVFLADIDGSISYSNIVQIRPVDIPEEYKPEDGAYFKLDIPEVYNNSEYKPTPQPA